MLGNRTFAGIALGETASIVRTRSRDDIAVSSSITFALSRVGDAKRLTRLASSVR